MITPSEILDKQFKNGLGYDKRDVELYLQDISSDLTILLQDHEDLKSRLKDANDSLAYYKSIERTLQKALILAEKTAQDTRETALKEAGVIEKEAKVKARQILSDAMKQTQTYEHKLINLLQQYDLFKIHFENLLRAQQELLDSKSFSINTGHFTYQDIKDMETDNPEEVNSKDFLKNLAAITSDSEAELHAQEDVNQLKFDFLKEEAGPGSYQTEDGFEFFTMKDK